MPISDAMRKLFPGKALKWEAWKTALTSEDLDTVGDIRQLSPEGWKELRLSAVLRDGLRKLRNEGTPACLPLQMPPAAITISPFLCLFAQPVC